MTVHEQFAEDLALYALGALQGDERIALETHLQDCSGCRRELEQVRGDMALMALSSVGPTPPRRSLRRLLDAIASQPRVRVVPRRWVWWAAVSWFATAVLALVTVVLWRQNADWQQTASQLQHQSTEQQAQLQRARDVLATLTATDALHVTLVAAKTPPQPQGKAIYLRNRASLIFLASNLPMLPPQKAYELWLIPTLGAPIPAGLFKPDAHGGATVINPPLPTGVEAKAFAITVEPEAGSATPTSQPIMVGAGE